MEYDVWELLLGLAGVLIAYVAFVSVTGSETTPAAVVLVLILGTAGLLLGRYIAEKISDEEAS